MTKQVSPDLLDLAEAVADGALRADDAERQVRAALGPEHNDATEKAVLDLRQLIVAANAVRSHVRAAREASTAESPDQAHGSASIATIVPGPVRVGAVHRRPSRGGDGRAPRRTWLLVAATLLIGTGLIGASLVGGRLFAPSPVPTNPNTFGPPPPTPPAPPRPDLSAGFSWTGSIPTTEGGPLRETATLLADGRVLVTGDCSTAVELYDPTTGTFSRTGSLTATRLGKTATLLQDGHVLITGGYNCGDAEHAGIWASAELYDPATGTFSATGSMSTPREFHTATLLADERVLITGGITGQSPVASVSVVFASYEHAMTAVTAESITLSSAEVYDPKTGAFSRTGSMGDFRNSHTATLLGDGRVLVVGGGGEGYASRTSAELYDPATGTFRSTGSMKSGRWLHTATLLQDGRVLVAGGRTPQDSVLATVEVYIPKTGKFTATGSMNTGRQSHTATLLLDGRVLIAGGYEQHGDLGQALSSTELYDPGTGKFTPIGSMGEQRASGTATLLNDGRVLIAGGFNLGEFGDSGAVGIPSAVLYQP